MVKFLSIYLSNFSKRMQSIWFPVPYWLVFCQFSISTILLFGYKKFHMVENVFVFVCVWFNFFLGMEFPVFVSSYLEITNSELLYTYAFTWFVHFHVQEIIEWFLHKIIKGCEIHTSICVYMCKCVFDFK